MLIVKFLVVALPLWLARHPMRTVILGGLSLAQVGEFSFILASRGLSEFGLMGKEDYQLFLAASVITMALTPLLIAIGPIIVDKWFAGGTGTKLPAEHFDPIAANCRRGHVIIAGFGSTAETSQGS